MELLAVPAQSEWGLDPLYWCFVRVLVAQVHALEGVPGLPGAFVFGPSKRPVTRVELVGTVKKGGGS
jgi:hypothetical protein